MNDASLDRELQSLMSAEPSPEFLARVRVRVAQEAAPSAWRTSWLFAVAGAVAVVIAAMIAWPSSEPVMDRSTPPLQAQQHPAVLPPIDVTTPGPVAPPIERRSRALRPLAAATADRARHIDLPEVMVAENEVRAYTAWVASIREHRFNVAVPVAEMRDTPIEVQAIPPVEPLEIEPIVRVAALQAEGERP